MSVAGTYNVNVKTPMGDQTGSFSVSVEGGSASATFSGGMGTMACEDVAVSGDTVTWKMKMTSPMPMTLDGTATVDGDALTGSLKAGAFGSIPLSGTRAA